ncbi:RDD family protein [Algivirga pacifica]|uniref:RDD domain-containing protein n=1 Tax=Algivirga pacifica TaxID=1162670 RepID=A0ABP9D8Y1_9BACT
MNSVTRGLNFIIDNLIFLLIAFSFSFLLQSTLEQHIVRNILIVTYYLYYFLFEWLLGKTPAKFLTKSQVVSLQGEQSPSFGQILIRTISRMLPIDFISYFFSGNGIHDYISKTRLVKC